MQFKANTKQWPCEVHKDGAEKQSVMLQGASA